MFKQGWQLRTWLPMNTAVAPAPAPSARTARLAPHGSPAPSAPPPPCHGGASTAGRGGKVTGSRRACAMTLGGPGRRRFRPAPRWRRPLSGPCHGKGRGSRVRSRRARHGRCSMGAPGERWRGWGEGCLGHGRWQGRGLQPGSLALG